MTVDETNDYIYESIIAGKPFLAARFGDAELRTLVYCMENQLGLRKGFPSYIKRVMHMNAGFFPANDDSLLLFGEILRHSAEKVDMYGVWYNLLEDYVINQCAPSAVVAELEALEPYRSKRPWSRALKGKRVLVVHPFEKSIQTQFEKRRVLFDNQDVLPDFSLFTYKAVQTNAGGESDYASWFEAFDAMKSDIEKIDFDVAIVGCGSYGLPLAAYIKEMGKIVIHLAGATQIMFGIRGARWDVRPEMQSLFNANWIRPDASEKPKNASMVEGACYW